MTEVHLMPAAQVAEYIQRVFTAAKQELHNKKETHQAQEIVDLLEQHISRIVPDKTVQVDRQWLQDSLWARLVRFKAVTQIEIGQADAVVPYLAPLVGPTGLLHDDGYAHAIYARALVRTGQIDTAIEHLKPLISESHPLYKRPEIHTIYSKALTAKNLFREAIQHLKPRVSVGGFLYTHHAAHINYVKALIADGKRADASRHLKPLVSPRGLLNNHLRAISIYRTLISVGANRPKYLRQQPDQYRHDS